MASGDVTATVGNLGDRPCAVFDGVDDKIDITALSLNTTTNFTITFSVLIKDNSIVNGILGSGATALGYLMYDGPAGRWKLELDTTGTIYQLVEVASNNTWYNVALSVDNTNVIYYINGTQKTPIALSGGADNFTPHEIGKYWGDTLDGGLRDLRIYNKVLTSTQIANIHNGKNITDNLIHSWRLESDYTDSKGSNDGTNAGTYLTTYPNNIVADTGQLNQATTDDKVIIPAVNGRNHGVKVLVANREA